MSIEPNGHVMNNRSHGRTQWLSEEGGGEAFSHVLHVM